MLRRSACARQSTKATKTAAIARLPGKKKEMSVQNWALHHPMHITQISAVALHPPPHSYVDMEPGNQQTGSRAKEIVF